MSHPTYKDCVEAVRGLLARAEEADRVLHMEAHDQPLAIRSTLLDMLVGERWDNDAKASTLDMAQVVRRDFLKSRELAMVAVGLTDSNDDLLSLVSRLVVRLEGVEKAYADAQEEAASITNFEFRRETSLAVKVRSIGFALKACREQAAKCHARFGEGFSKSGSLLEKVAAVMSENERMGREISEHKAALQTMAEQLKSEQEARARLSECIGVDVVAIVSANGQYERTIASACQGLVAALRNFRHVSPDGESLGILALSEVCARELNALSECFNEQCQRADLERDRADKAEGFVRTLQQACLAQLAGVPMFGLCDEQYERTVLEKARADKADAFTRTLQQACLVHLGGESSGGKTEELLRPGLWAAIQSVQTMTGSRCARIVREASRECGHVEERDMERMGAALRDAILVNLRFLYGFRDVEETPK